MGVRRYKIVLLSTLVIVSIIALVTSFSYAGVPSTFTKSLSPYSYNNAPVIHLDPLRGVDVEISPSFQNANPGTTLTYIVEITNTGDADETYYSTGTDNLGWEIAFGIKQVTISPSDSVFTTLKVTIPENALGSTQDIIMIIMTSLDNTVSDNASCSVQASIIKGVSLEISPAENFGFPQDEVTFSIVVRNTGDVYDNFDLSANDNSGWSPTLETAVLDGVPPGQKENTVLGVTIPENAATNSKDNITVVAASKTDPTISDNRSCMVNVMHATRGVSISISPSENDGYPSDVITFIVSVNNTGNAKDNFGLTVSDNSSWSPNVSPTSLVLAASSGGNATLSVTIPPGAIGGTVDNISVTATSRHDNTKSDNKTVTAKVIVVRGVSVSISPNYENGENGATLTYTVTVSNTGNVSDNYGLIVIDNAGWSPTVSPTPLTITGKTNGTATLTVVVPTNAIPDTIDSITVTAISQFDNTISDNAGCTAQAVAAVSPPPTPPPPGPQPNPSPSITDNTPPPAPSLISPPNGATITDNTPTLDWSDVSDPSGVAYNLSIAKGAGFALIVLLKDGLKVSTYDLTPGEALVAGTYYWRVRAVDNAGNASSWSENWSFTVSPGSHPPPPTPATFIVSDLTISPTGVTLGGKVSISVKVKNTGDLGGTYTAILKIDGVVENIENVSIIGGSTKTVMFTVTKEVEGTYHVEVDNLTGEFAVLTPPIGLAIPILIILLIAILAIVAMVMKRMRKKPQRRSKTR
jgi:uncharacterized membrane protein